jgi:tRNA nucleotidyltransferase/poly(A) polymerase
MTKRIKELKNMSKNRKELPKPLLNGNDIIKNFKIKPGPQIGGLLRVLREEQLSGKIEDKGQGLKILEKYLQKRK